MIANLVNRSVCAGLVAAGLALSTAPAGAQPAMGAGDGDVSGIVVYAPQHFARQPTTGARVQLDEVSTRVDVSDLDLGTRYGAQQARRRIEQAARDVCDQAQREYPADGDVADGCYATALRDALGQAQAVAGYPIVAWGYR